MTEDKELMLHLVFQSYKASRDAGMPYRPANKSIWGNDNDALEVMYQEEKEGAKDDSE